MSNRQNDERNMFQGNNMICLQLTGKDNLRMENNAYLEQVREEIHNVLPDIIESVNDLFKGSIADQHGGLGGTFSSWIMPDSINLKEMSKED